MKVKDLILWCDSLNQKSKKYNHIFYKICFLLSLVIVIHYINKYYADWQIIMTGIIAGMLLAISMSLVIKES